MTTAVSVALFAVLIAGCAGTGGGINDDRMTAEEFQMQQDEQARADEINQQLMVIAAESSVDDSVYRVGPNDSISIHVHGVEDLSGDYRVDGGGSVNLPLIGYTDVAGYSLAEAEDIIADAYGESYVRNPQVRVTVSEYRSQQFTAIGAVRSPRVYNVDRQVTLLEALAMSGGLAGSAGTSIHLTDRVRDSESGQLNARSLVVDVDDLMREPNEFNLVLGESAVVNVPKAGSVFVEGQVEKPGIYSMDGDTTILKAITMAGGVRFQASRSNVRVLSRDRNSGEWQEETVNYNEIRESPWADQKLNDGDIVLVQSSAVRAGLAGSWDVIRSIVFLGYRPLR